MGGVNQKTIAQILDSGADNIVIGSYITRSKNIPFQIANLRKYVGTLGYNLLNLKIIHIRIIIYLKKGDYL
jgi:hypothetical protein